METLAGVSGDGGVRRWGTVGRDRRWGKEGKANLPQAGQDPGLP